VLVAVWTSNVILLLAELGPIFESALDHSAMINVINIHSIRQPGYLSQCSVWLRTGRSRDRGSIPGRGKYFSCSSCVQTSSGAHPASCTMRAGGPFPGCKSRPGRDADHSPPSNAEVMNEWELYLLPSQAPPWRVVGLLYFLLIIFGWKFGNSACEYQSLR
jgi:hypothetical protein